MIVNHRRNSVTIIIEPANAVERHKIVDYKEINDLHFKVESIATQEN